jgi:hypothetical protein
LDTFGDTPRYGDERSFLDARREDQTQPGAWADPVTNVTAGSRRIIVRVYVNNDADPETNASGKGVATGTRVRLAVPTGPAIAQRVRGYVSADNAQPHVVENTLDLIDPHAFSLQYVPGSAVMYDKATGDKGVRLADTIVGPEGALVGWAKPDGRVLGGFYYKIAVLATLAVQPVG